MGYEISDYHGRFGYHGPSVKCSAQEFQDVLRSTEVRVMWESLGKGYVVYPENPQCLARAKGEAMDRIRFDRALRDLGVEWKRDV